MINKICSFGRILLLSGKRYASDQLGQRSVALTYYTLFSIVPLAALFFGVAKGFSLEEPLKDALYSRFTGHHEFLDWTYRFADTTLQRSSGSVVAGVGVIALLWTVIWLISHIEKSFNAVWGLPPRRNLWRKFSDYISLLLLTPLLLVAISTLGMILRSKLLQLGDALGAGWGAHLADFGAGVAPVLAACILFMLIYKFVPNTKVDWYGALAAGIFTGICFQLLQNGFLFLQKSVFTYNQIYGSFAALPLFLVWLNWSWQVVLFGAELSCVWQYIDTGVFGEKEQVQLSLKLRREHQLAILRLIFSEFENGNGALAENDIAQRLKLPELVLRDEINELLELKMLCRSVVAGGGIGFLPGLPPDKCTVLDFIRKVNGSGDNESAEFARFDRIFREMEDVLEKSSGNVNIYQA